MCWVIFFSEFEKKNKIMRASWHCGIKGSLEICDLVTSQFLPHSLPPQKKLYLDEVTITSTEWSLLNQGKTDSSNIFFVIKSRWSEEKLHDQRERECGCRFSERFRAHKAVNIAQGISFYVPKLIRVFLGMATLLWFCWNN